MPCLTRVDVNEVKMSGDVDGDLHSLAAGSPGAKGTPANSATG